MSAWSDLSNARHIDRVIETLNSHHDIWYKTRWVVQTVEFDNGVVSESRAKARKELHRANRLEVWYAAQVAIIGASHGAPGPGARAAILALVTYDDCDQYLNMSSDQLRVWSLLTEHPAAILLLPAVIAFERIKELESV